MKPLANTQSNMLEQGQVNYLAGNDQDYFSSMYDIYAASLYGLILKWIKEKEIAEILLHDTFEKAWHNRKLFTAETESLYCWLCRMARICYHEKLK